MLNPFLSMLGQMPQMLQQPQGGYGAGYWLGGMPQYSGSDPGSLPLGGGSMGFLMPWDYQVPQPVYQPSFLDVPPSVAPRAAQGGPGGAGVTMGHLGEGKYAHPDSDRPTKLSNAQYRNLLMGGRGK